ncbi:MAG TPA: hypothetical protein VMP13_06180 [Acidimicrobiia bacterium]|nr:hypothetical protein [Acidimicrobiia bacterium]
MNRLRRQQRAAPTIWRVCLQCGNRYEAANHGYKVNWCSSTCEHASLKQQRNEIETSWIRARWFLR